MALEGMRSGRAVGVIEDIAKHAIVAEAFIARLEAKLVDGALDPQAGRPGLRVLPLIRGVQKI